MIRVNDPGRLGVILGTLRTTEGWGRREIARAIAERTGHTENTINTQLWNWDNGHLRPESASLTHYLDVLGYQLAIVPKEDA
jgi:hypothetical protein